MNGPRLVRWDEPGGNCQGCAGCSIRRALAERDSFTRGEVAHLLALAFRSGAQLAHDMAEDITRWAADPIVVKSAHNAYRARRASMDAGTERWRRRLVAATVTVQAGIPLGLDARDGDDVVVDPEVEWPEVATLGGSESA